MSKREVGIAMGIRGTEVAKEAADIVLLDDDLTSVVAGMAPPAPAPDGHAVERRQFWLGSGGRCGTKQQS